MSIFTPLIRGVIEDSVVTNEVFGGFPVPLLFMPLVSDLSLTQGTGEATFTRTTIATFINKDSGLLETASIDAARFESEGVLIEGASTNLFTRSEEFDEGIWVKLNSSITANATAAPDGTVTADKLVEDSATALHAVRQLRNFTPGTYTQYTFAKKAERDVLQIFLGGDHSSTDFANFDLTNGVISLRVGLDSAFIKPLVDGWFLCSVTFTTARSGNASQYFTASNSLTLPRAGTYLGDGTSGLLIWGAQLEELPFASSYIRTLGTAVTRGADVLGVPSAGNFNEVEGTISLTAEVIGDTEVNQYLLDITDGTGNNRIRLFRSLDKIQIVITNGGTVQVNISTAFDMEVGQQYKILVNYKDNNVEFFVDGVSIGTDVVVNMPTGLTTVDIGQNLISTELLFGHIKKLKFFDVNLTASQRAAL